jgi:hypothetical protein
MDEHAQHFEAQSDDVGSVSVLSTAGAKVARRNAGRDRNEQREAFDEFDILQRPHEFDGRGVAPLAAQLSQLRYAGDSRHDDHESREGGAQRCYGFPAHENRFCSPK